MVVHPSADADPRWEPEMPALVQAGFDAGATVRLVTPHSFGPAMVRTVPTERVLPDPGEMRSADPVCALLDDLLTIPTDFARSMAALGLHVNDIVLFPVAGACELLGIARWMGESWPGCAVVAGLPAITAVADEAEQHRLFRAVANQLRRGPTDRLALVASKGDAGRYTAAELPNVVVGELCPPGARTLADLLPSWPVARRTGEVAATLSPLVDPCRVRRGFKVPEDVTVVVVWGEEGVEDVLVALSAVPWAATALVVVVGAQPDGRFPLTVGTLAAPATDEELCVVAALGDLHVVPGAAAADGVARALMEQGRALLCRPTPGVADLLSPAQTIDGPLAPRLCGLLLRPELLAALGRRNRAVLEGASCGPA